MKKVMFLALGLLASSFSYGQKKTVEVGGELMYPQKNIVENAVNSADHTTLVAAVKAAGLVETLQGEGPFTVFAPVNAAFDALPKGTVSTLLKPANQGQLQAVLTYHVVAGRLDFAALAKMIDAGQKSVETVQGQKLKLSRNGPRNIVLEDQNGNTASISTYDVYQSNGVIHVIDKVLLPAS